MNYTALIRAINSATTQLQGRAATVVNQTLVMRNWLVGAYIVGFEQEGADRAKYGTKLLETLAGDLKAKNIKGLGAEILRNCRLFFLNYPQISQTVSGKLAMDQLVTNISQTVSGKLALAGRTPESPKLPTPLSAEKVLCFSWSQLQELIRMDDPWKRAFYENECLRNHWSVRQLQRQIGSLLYERTGLSTDKQAVIERARKQQASESIADVMRDPYILEFTGLADLPSYSEDELETALLDHLQKFLLELGQGFCFEARQFRMTEGRRHHRVDLMFYHRILRCHVLIDLKIRNFKPEDAGQMNFYVNWVKARLMQPGDNPPVGILLCSDKDKTEVEFATAGMDQKLFVSRYLVALPSAEKLRAFLETDRDLIESQMPQSSAKKRSPRKTKS